MALTARKPPARSALAWLVIIVALGRAARADDPPPPAPAQSKPPPPDGVVAAPARVLVPPAPIELPKIELPATVPPLTAAVQVEVVMTIDTTGAVAEVEVTKSGGAEIDEVVVAGVKLFRFQAATQDGVAIPVRIPFTQRFEPPPPPLVKAAPDLDAIIEGIVITRGTRTPIAAATVVAIDAQDTHEYLAVTDPRGVFTLPVRAGRALEIRISAAEHEKFVQKEILQKDQHLKVKYLVDRKSYGQYESYVRAEADRTEVSRTTLAGREITRIPGTFGDPFRVINVLPGVSSAMGLLPLPIVRGSSPGNTGMLLDEIRVPLLFHLFAGPSVIHPEFIDRVDFYPGGFPVKYGGYTGGIVDGVTRPARPDERRVDLDITLTQTGGLVREPIPALGATATVAGRIGYPGILLSLLSPDASLSYWDYQARIDRGTDHDRWTVFAYGAEDTLKRRPAVDQPLQTFARFAFHRVDLRYLHGSDKSYEQYRVVLGYDDSMLGGEPSANVSGDAATGNGTWSAHPQIRIGRAPLPWLDLALGLESDVRTVSNPQASTVVPTTQRAMNAAMILNPSGTFSASGFFVQAVFKPAENVRLIPGVRGDLYDQRQDPKNTTQWSADPRFLARYRLSGDKLGGIWLKGVIGRYHQPPRIFLPVPGLDVSSLDLGLLASTQYSVGAEAKLAPGIDLDVNVYYNSMNPVLFDLVVNQTSADMQQRQPPNLPWQLPPGSSGTGNDFANLFMKRVGRSYGLEVLLRKRDSERLFGWLSYTLSRSQRLQPEGWELFDFDRLHILNFVSGIRLPRNWELSTRVLLQSGTPLTTIFGSNIARSGGQFRLDLRLDKRAVWNRWLLDFYVDIINTTVAEETGGLVGSDAIRYIIPTLGFRAML